MYTSPSSSTPSSYATLLSCRALFSFVSFLGSVFIIFTFFYLKKRYKLHYRLVFWLAVSNLLFSLSSLMTAFPFVHVRDDSAFCHAQALLLSFSQKSAWMFVSGISLNMLLISYGVSAETMLSKEKYFHIASYVVAISFVVVGWKHSGAEHNQNLCGADDDYIFYELYLALAVFFIANTICISFTIYKYVQMFKSYGEVQTTQLTTRNKKRLHTFLLRLSSYPLVFLLCYTGILITIIYYVAAGHLGKKKITDIPLGFQVASQMIWLDGFINAIVFGYSDKIWKEYRKRWTAWRKAPNDTSGSSTEYENINF